MNHSESDESVSPLTKASSRVVGAELIRQLSCQKFHQSDETLHQYRAAKRKTGAPIIKRFSDNHHDRRQRPVTVVKAVSERPSLTRQSTSTNSESVTTGAVIARRHHLAQVKDHRNWRSCDANHPEVAGTHRQIGQSIGQTSPSSLDLAASFNSLSAGRPTTASSHFVSISPSAQSTTTATVNHRNELESQQQEQQDASQQEAPPNPLQQHQEPVRYYSGQRAGLEDGQEEDRVVLPPLAGNLVINTKNSKLLSQRMAKVAGSKTKKVLAKQPATCPAAKTNRRRQTNKAAPGAVAMAAIAVAVVTGNDGSSDINNVPNPRRRARGIVILTSVFLLFTCLFLVGITLRLAPLIDELGKISFPRYLKLIRQGVLVQLRDWSSWTCWPCRGNLVAS